MSKYIKFSTGEQVGCQSVMVRNELLAGHIRSVATITTTSATYDAVAALFKEGAVWSIVEDGHTYTEWNTYTKAGAITDNRDGTIAVKMGKANTAEQDALDAQKKAEEEARNNAAALSRLAGKLITSEADIEALRKRIEAIADNMTEEEIKSSPSLCKEWTVDEKVQAGCRRYYSADGYAYKCLKEHTTSISIRPDSSPDYWEKLI